MKKNIVFIGFSYDYEKMDINSLKEEFIIHDIYINERINFFISKILFFKLLYKLTITNYITYKLSKIKKIDLIITKDNLDVLDSIMNRNEKKILILRNIVSENIKKYLSHFIVYTFNKKDAFNLNLNSYNQYSSAIDYSKDKTFHATTDLTFIGQDKGRAKFLDELKKNIDDRINCSFLIIKKTNLIQRFINNLFPSTKKNLSYLEYLAYQYQGKAILELVQNNQTSETMRLVEALSAKKKVITNNQEILKHNLYNKKNILIFKTLDDLNESIFHFINSPFDESVLPLLDNYSAQKVLSNIINNVIDNINPSNIVTKND